MKSFRSLGGALFLASGLGMIAFSVPVGAQTPVTARSSGANQLQSDGEHFDYDLFRGADWFTDSDQPGDGKSGEYIWQSYDQCGQNLRHEQSRDVRRHSFVPFQYASGKYTRVTGGFLLCLYH